MTPESHDQEIARVARERDAQRQPKWLIWSMEHSAWWRADHSGYTTTRVNAGRYSFSDALDIVHNANYAPECAKHPHEAMILDEI
jgi:hypothetical protein